MDVASTFATSVEQTPIQNPKEDGKIKKASEAEKNEGICSRIISFVKNIFTNIIYYITCKTVDLRAKTAMFAGQEGFSSTASRPKTKRENVLGGSLQGNHRSKNDTKQTQPQPTNGKKKETSREETSKVDSRIDFSEIRQFSFEEVLETYCEFYTPCTNLENLRKYHNLPDYQRHAKTACIYYNSNQLSQSDALKVIYRREPTNISMGDNQYKKEKLEELFGYRQGVYNDPNIKKENGQPFGDLPNSATVYSETYLWPTPGGGDPIEVACLSLPAPALDTSRQPHYKYYMRNNLLDVEKYEQEMEFLFKTIERAVREHKDSAFERKGIKRVVLSRFGQGAFLGALNYEDRLKANQVYKNKMEQFLDNVSELGIDIVMSEYSNPTSDNRLLDNMIVGDIIKTAKAQDLIINAWDPHSAPGNGNDNDQSFDGAMGRGSGILLTQTSWLNQTLRREEALRAVE